MSINYVNNNANVQKRQLNKSINAADNVRKISSMGAKAVTIGAATLAANSVVKNENSSVKNTLSKGVDFTAGLLKKGINFVDKKNKTGIAGILDKVKNASAKTKALGAIALTAALSLIRNIQTNNRLKGAFAQAKADGNAFYDTVSSYEKIVIPRTVKKMQRKTKDDIAFNK